ncbi:MAG: topoisomerase DNA-binding C4 zinc finger domain-containing protein [Promethearchaeota archaeon]
MKIIGYAGECPKCSDELVIWRSKAGGRFIKCENEDCQFSYPIPRSGKIEYMGLQCPILKLPIFKVEKKSKKNGIIYTYFWATSPCFTCNLSNRCNPLIELKEEFGIA